MTIRRPLPAGWTSATVLQKGIKLASQLVTVNSVTSVMFDALPDNGAILIVKGTASGVNDSGSSSLPQAFTLYQNYPNPFNPSTKISYYVPTSQFVELKIFNVLGKEITTLVSGLKPAGLHTVEFTGNNLANGVYICRMFVGDQLLSRRMLLLK